MYSPRHLSGNGRNTQPSRLLLSPDIKSDDGGSSSVSIRLVSSSSGNKQSTIHPTLSRSSSPLCFRGGSCSSSGPSSPLTVAIPLVSGCSTPVQHPTPPASSGHVHSPSSFHQLRHSPPHCQDLPLPSDPLLDCGGLRGTKRFLSSLVTPCSSSPSISNCLSISQDQLRLVRHTPSPPYVVGGSLGQGQGLLKSSSCQTTSLTSQCFIPASSSRSNSPFHIHSSYSPNHPSGLSSGSTLWDSMSDLSIVDDDDSLTEMNTSDERPSFAKIRRTEPSSSVIKNSTKKKDFALSDKNTREGFCCPTSKDVGYMSSHTTYGCSSDDSSDLEQLNNASLCSSWSHEARARRSAKLLSNNSSSIKSRGNNNLSRTLSGRTSRDVHNKYLKKGNKHLISDEVQATKKSTRNTLRPSTSVIISTRQRHNTHDGKVSYSNETSLPRLEDGNTTYFCNNSSRFSSTNDPSPLPLISRDDGSNIVINQFQGRERLESNKNPRRKLLKATRSCTSTSMPKRARNQTNTQEGNCHKLEKVDDSQESMNDADCGLINPEIESIKLKFTSAINDEEKETDDSILPKSVIDSIVLKSKVPLGSPNENHRALVVYQPVLRTPISSNSHTDDASENSLFSTDDYSAKDCSRGLKSDDHTRFHDVEMQ